MTAQPPAITVKVKLIAAGDSDVNPVSVITVPGLAESQVVVIVPDLRGEVGSEVILQVQADQVKIIGLAIDTSRRNTWSSDTGR